MHEKLARALALLEFTQGESLSQDAVRGLFEYFYLAGYLSSPLVTQAVEYLAVAHPFAKDEAMVKEHLLAALPEKSAPINLDFFFKEFAKQDYFTIGDILELIVFLQQTAFDRNFGVERDRLTAKPWMEQYAADFIRCATLIGITEEHVPQQKSYLGVGIMGAASFRIRTRLEYFKELKISYDEVWALSGERELSKGLDEDNVMKELAQYLQKEETYVQKPVGKDIREFLSGITETQMVNYLIQKICPDKKIGLIDSKRQEGHWRATTSQNAADIVPIILERIKEKGSTQKEGISTYYFLIIAEQPYSKRMATQVQRAFDQEIQKRKLPIKMIVEGSGQGIDKAVLSSPEKHLPVLARMNSELGAAISERYNNAKLNKPEYLLRNPDILMFSKRNDYCEKLRKEKQAKNVPVQEKAPVSDPTKGPRM